MKKTIFVTGATDGIGQLAATMLAGLGHQVLLHGRNPSKLAAAAAEVGGHPETYLADLSRTEDVETMATDILKRHRRLDVLINNAGVLKTPELRTREGLDVRFMVNTLAPYVLTKRLLEIVPREGRIINLSSAAQARVNVAAMKGEGQLEDMAAYAQSKLAITIWSQELARELRDGPVVVAVNPGSLLASKMVKEGFGVPGHDLKIGADILCRAALDPSFEDASGKYFDNDLGHFAPPDPAAADSAHVQAVMTTLHDLVAKS